MKKLFLIPILSVFFLSCSDSKQQSEHDLDIAGLDGKELMENKCFSCHNTQGTDKMLAPPMQRVKDHYWDEDVTRDEFITAIADWCENPTEEESVMPGARRKFGLMPKQAFDRKEVKAIANYLYDHDLDQSCSH